jgi:ABC-2 type transport system permease protein
MTSSPLLAMLHRDLYVAGKGVVPLLVTALTQPLLLVFILGNVMPRLNIVSDGYTTLMLPGIAAMSILAAGIQAVLLPLTVDLGHTREIEDRILAPVAVKAVALEKIVTGALQATLAGIVVLPLAKLIMHGQVTVDLSHPFFLTLVMLLSGLLSASFGLFVGTLVDSKMLSMMFSLVIGPLVMFGCIYYPWRGLEQVPWMQKFTLFNPLVYIGESIRAALTPDVPHMSVWLILCGLLFFVSLFSWLGANGFQRRTIR